MCILMRPPLSSRSSTNRVVRKFAHAHIAILASSYSDDVIAIEVKKLKNPYQISRISFGEIP